MNVMNPDQPAMPGAQPNQSLADLFGVTAAIMMLRRRFLIMLLVAAVAGAGAFAALMMGTPVYKATALVMINPRQERVLSGEDVIGQLPRDSSTIDSEIELLRSPALMTELVDALGLMRRTTEEGEEAQDLMADNLASTLQVRRRGLTYVIEISASSHDPARAQLDREHLRRRLYRQPSEPARRHRPARERLAVAPSR